jgi:hypothetical protein
VPCLAALGARVPGADQAPLHADRSDVLPRLVPDGVEDATQVEARPVPGQREDGAVGVGMELQHRAGLAVDGTEVVAGSSGQGREAATEVDDPSVRRGLQGVDRAVRMRIPTAKLPVVHPKGRGVGTGDLLGAWSRVRRANGGEVTTDIDRVPDHEDGADPAIGLIGRPRRAAQRGCLRIRRGDDRNSGERRDRRSDGGSPAPPRPT